MLKLLEEQENLDFLTGAGGWTSASYKVCKEFSTNFQGIFNTKLLLITACTCLRLPVLNGATVHSHLI